MNNSVDPGPPWNGPPNGLDYEAYNGQQGRRMNPNSGSSLMNGNPNHGPATASHNMGAPQTIFGPMTNTSNAALTNSAVTGNNPNAGYGIVNPNTGQMMNSNTATGVNHQNLSRGTINPNTGQIMNPSMLQRTAPFNMQTLSNARPQMNGYQPNFSGQTNVNMSTPSSVGARFPMWDMDIPSQMFMQAINFEQLMGTQGGMADASFGSVQGSAGPSADVMNSTRLSEASNHKSGKLDPIKLKPGLF